MTTNQSSDKESTRIAPNTRLEKQIRRGRIMEYLLVLAASAWLAMFLGGVWYYFSAARRYEELANGLNEQKASVDNLVNKLDRQAGELSELEQELGRQSGEVEELIGTVSEHAVLLPAAWVEYIGRPVDPEDPESQLWRGVGIEAVDHESTVDAGMFVVRFDKTVQVLSDSYMYLVSPREQVSEEGGIIVYASPGAEPNELHVYVRFTEASSDADEKYRTFNLIVFDKNAIRE